MGPNHKNFIKYIFPYSYLCATTELSFKLIPPIIVKLYYRTKIAVDNTTMYIHSTCRTKITVDTVHALAQGMGTVYSSLRRSGQEILPRTVFV